MQIIADPSFTVCNAKFEMPPASFHLSHLFYLVEKQVSYYAPQVSIIDHRVVIVAGCRDRTEPAPKSACAQKVEVVDIKNETLWGNFIKLH